MNVQIIGTTVVLVAYILIRFVSGKTVDKTVVNSLMQKTRGKVLKKKDNFLLLIVMHSFQFIIWGVNPSELVIFISSFPAILGVALFAHWSILTNITSGIIIIFSHPVKLDDTICTRAKDYQNKGRVSDIGLFYVCIKTKEGDRMTAPSNVIVQKMLKHPTYV